jgi:pimeloyl-ACP methyl ester carboxylesterase
MRVHAVTRQYCHIGSRTIAYLDSAPGGDKLRALVLLHAFPIGANLWEPQVRTIPAGWRVITPDLRGFGGSTELDSLSAPASAREASYGAASPERLEGRGGGSMADYAQDVIDLMDELGVKRAVVGGASMGGYAAFALLQLAGDRIDGLILANTRAGADSPEARANRRNMLALVDREGPSGVARDMMPRLLGKTTQEIKPDIEAFVRRLIKQQSPIAIRTAISRMMHRPDSTPLLPKITVPTLVITGEEDELIPVDESRAMAKAIPGATLVIVPRAGHLANLEQPEAFNQALHEFLAKL